MSTRKSLIVLLSLLLPVAAAPARDIVCQSTRDVWLSAVGKETGYNMGGANRIKLKVWQEFGLVDFNTAALKGKTIQSAYLYVKPTGGGKLNLNGGSDLRWLSVSTISQRWAEGEGTSYAPPPRNGCTFNENARGQGNWGFDGAKCWDVILGNGNSLRCDVMLEPDPSKEGWLRAELKPEVVQALAAQASYGLMLMDGSTSVGTNNTIGTHEAKIGPVLVVSVDEADRQPPAAVKDLRITPAPNWATPELGALWVHLTVPEDAFAYHLKINGQGVERWQIPFAAKAGTEQSFPILDLPPGKDVTVTIVAVDAAGNPSPTTTAKGTVSPPLTVPTLPESPFQPTAGAPKRLGSAVVWAFPEITKVDPVSGEVRHEKTTGDIRTHNAIWDGSKGLIRLAAARGEIISFQLAVEGKVRNCTIDVSSLRGPGTISDQGVNIWRNWYVERESEYALPLHKGFDCPAADNRVEGQKLQAVTVDYHIPTDTKAGTYEGTLTLRAGQKALKLPLAVKVYDVVIPDEVHFNPELNCYGGPGQAGSDKFNDSFRLAHYHRCTINRVPYSQNGRVHDDWIPQVNGSGKVTNWANFDKNLGGLLDGSLFRNNPRAGVPVPTFYLPLFEGWPKNYRDHYNPGPGVPVNGKDHDAKLRHDTLAKPIDEAIDKTYRQAFINCTQDFADHVKKRGWNQTLFEMYLNNKPNYGYTMWTLDEPFEYLDWAALNFFGRLFKEGIDDPAVYTLAWQRELYRKGLKEMNRQRGSFLYRGDISRPMWQGNVSDGIINIMYVGGVWSHMPRLLRMTKVRGPMILYSYGSCNDVNRSNWESAAWCIKAFANNSDGVLPWQSLGGKGSLVKPSKTSLIIDAPPFGHAIASFRVHALRRGAQDCELLRLLQLKNDWSREHIGLLVSQKVPMTSQFQQAFQDEAAAIQFGTLTGQGFCEMKEGVLQLLSEE